MLELDTFLRIKKRIELKLGDCMKCSICGGIITEGIAHVKDDKIVKLKCRECFNDALIRIIKKSILDVVP